ncbi:C-type lectin domain family 17, member A-like [Oryzias melastigma]|uniref:C-type lectin domain family 17, member A-like n=1 Tax=Oryzias melastigma TaxID=30732 RepID=UPI000CF82CC2|nr:C-type lectin domain family 17, member A-like [Oryzias melastigma]
MSSSCIQQQTELSVNTSCQKDNIKKVTTEDTKCPDRWTRFESSCYYKSTYLAPWDISRMFCQREGSYLVIINSVEEKDFVTKVNHNEESWIGLHVGWSPQKKEFDWIWVDGSPLAEIFRKTENLNKVTDHSTEAYLNAEGKITERSGRKSKLFTCEK